MPCMMLLGQPLGLAMKSGETRREARSEQNQNGQASGGMSQRMKRIPDSLEQGGPRLGASEFPSLGQSPEFVPQQGNRAAVGLAQQVRTVRLSLDQQHSQAKSAAPCQTLSTGRAIRDVTSGPSCSNLVAFS